MSKKLLVLIVLCVTFLTLGGMASAAPAVLNVGSDTAFAPFEFQGEGMEYEGFDIDLIKAIGRAMGSEAKVQGMNFDGLIPALEAGNIDCVISAMTITEERGKKVNFSTPYYKSGLSIVVRNNDNSIRGFGDLNGKHIAVQIGTTGADKAKEVPGAVIREFNTAPEAFLELQAGGVDAVINDLPVNEYYIAVMGGRGGKLVGEPLTSEDYGIATAKSNPQLTSEINAALQQLKDSGEYAAIYVKWFNRQPPQ
jgi:polar amino acid transport system substrate-binding protein